MTSSPLSNITIPLELDKISFKSFGATQVVWNLARYYKTKVSFGCR